MRAAQCPYYYQMGNRPDPQELETDRLVIDVYQKIGKSGNREYKLFQFIFKGWNLQNIVVLRHGFYHTAALQKNR